jgi:hypothetical protein
MASWARFDQESRAIAAAGRRLLWVPGIGFGYLATTRRDGGPRVHPINVLILDGVLHAFLVPSPKREDLRRDGRYALHSTGGPGVNDEFAITGRAKLSSADQRAAAAAAAGYSVGDDHELMEFDIDSALWAEYATPPGWPPTYHHWRTS